MNSQARVKIIDPYFKQDGRQSSARAEYATTFPVNGVWLRSISDKKKISIRKFSVYPETNYFHIAFITKIGTSDKGFRAAAVWNNGRDTFDLLHDVADQFNRWYAEQKEAAASDTVLNFRLKETILSASVDTKVEIVFPLESQKLLNQVPYRIQNPDYDPTKPEGAGNPKTIYAINPDSQFRPDVVDPKTGTVVYSVDAGDENLFANVWDRQRLFMHASFSHARNHFVCEMNETFIMMEKDFNYNAAQFDIWFSLDGRKPFILHNDNYMFELAFTAKENEFKR